MATLTEHLKNVLTRTREEAGKVIIGQSGVIDLALIAIFLALTVYRLKTEKR